MRAGQFHHLPQANLVDRDRAKPRGQVVKHSSIAAVSKERVRFRVGPETPIEGRSLGRDDQLGDPLPERAVGFMAEFGDRFVDGRRARDQVQTKLTPGLALPP